jgi:hypothetical protein
MTHDSLLQSPTSPAPAFLRFTNDREKVLVIGESCFNPLHTPPTPLAFVAVCAKLSPDNFSFSGGRMTQVFSYPVCRACHVNLPPAACRIDDPHAALKRQIPPPNM